MAKWSRATRFVPGDESRYPAKDLEGTAIEVAGGGLYTLYHLRWDNGVSQYVAYLGGTCKADTESISDYIDLVTGAEYVLSSHDADVEARKITVKQLPEDLRARWPRNSKGKWIVGYDSSGRGEELKRDEFHALAMGEEVRIG